MTAETSPKPDSPIKRLAFCFDGTWNKLDADTPTNVVLTAASIVRRTNDGITQIIHYDDGVGTGRLEHWSGGVFGAGLLENIREAYRFLLFNYDPGDEIYVFGFSRGAFSARTFIGFLRHVGILRRLHASRIDEALKLYCNRTVEEDGLSEAFMAFRADFADNVCVGEKDEAWRCTNASAYTPGSAHQLSVRYVGLWDTVGALGVPEVIPGSRWLNRKHGFHDPRLTRFVEAGRHAIAIDERRAFFPVLPWEGLDELNRERGFEPDSLTAPYQQKWFPGTHGGVGGGGDIRGLSDGALAWVLRGAKLAGLRLDHSQGSRIHGFAPDPFASLSNTVKPASGFTHLLKKDRPKVERIEQLSLSAIRRWQALGASLPEKRDYRPSPLSSLEEPLKARAVSGLPEPGDFTTQIVEPGDTLGRLARRIYGDLKLWRAIYEANRDTLDDPDEIFPGQVLRIPNIAPAEDSRPTAKK